MDQPSTGPVTPGQKTYVFVDEYNRHKRLKVMRACDGCRKRKIRCDGALQNGPWPCGACVRLKLKCVPPTLDQDDDESSPDGTPSSSQFAFQTTTLTSRATSNDGCSTRAGSREWSVGAPSSTVFRSSGPTSAPLLQQREDTAAYTSPMLNQPLARQVQPGYSEDDYFTSIEPPTQFQRNNSGPPNLFRTQTEASNSSSGDPKEVDAAVKELSGHMGDLAIELNSVAPYITREKQMLAETPAVEEAEVVLPPSVATDSAVRIPPEMMPSEERAMDYFGYFFDHIHPYVPVLNRREFLEQWRTSRHFISPLILEGIFACVARYLEEPIEVRRWLALAARHEESFKDVPRLSTVQALIILSKAREFAPKRGYYYRSWMAIKYMTAMSIELGLHEHQDQHRGTNVCTLGRSDCSTRTRIWQTLFLLEILVGGSQGRSDFAVEIDSVAFQIQKASPAPDDFEYRTSRRTTYFAQVVRNIKHTNTLWHTKKRLTDDWALDPNFVRHNEAIDTWLDELPPDLQLNYGDDDRSVFLSGNHYVAYLHTYHNLVVIMHHRPQLVMLLGKGDQSFKKHLDICNDAATIICRLQEALFREFGLHGLQFMLRGIGFTIYCILTCTMLHLATITSPDPVINTRARTYFTRHMRILEHCISNASAEMQVQIDTLREAFSADTSKPFELKQNLGLRSPSPESQTASIMGQQDAQSSVGHGSSEWATLQDASSSKTLSPSSQYSQPFYEVPSQPAMAFRTSSLDIPVQTAYAPTSLHRVTSAPHTGYALERVVSNEQPAPVWDPSGIFHHWNTAFGQPQATASQHSTSVPDPRTQLPSAPLMHQPLTSAGQPSLYTSPQTSSNAGPVAPDAMPIVPSVTPFMWQDAFTNAYVSGHGHKRYREESLVDPYSQYPKRRG